MIASNLRQSISSLVLCLAALVTALPAHAAVDCAAPSGVDRYRACQAAAGGVESLRRFSERTRNIYTIYVHDYANAVAATAAAPDNTGMNVRERK